MSDSVSAPSGAGKPTWSHGPRPWKQPRPHRQRRATAQGEHYIAAIVAEAIKRSSGKGCAKRILLLHLEQARARLAAIPPHLPGRDTADVMLTALHAIARDNPRRLAGLTASGFCKALGFDRHPDTCAAAVRLLATLTPLVVRAGRFSWGCDLLTVRRLAPDDPRLAKLEAWWPGDASPMCPQLRLERRPDPARQVGGPARDPSSDDVGEYRERGCALVLVQHSAAEGQILEHGQPPGLGCASPAPAESAPPCSNAPAAGTVDAPLTSSGWLQSLPTHRRQREAGLLVYACGLDFAGRTAYEAAKDLVNMRVSTVPGSRVGHREVAALARGLEGLQRRGILGLGWAPPPIETHEALAVLGIRTRPSERMPSKRMQAHLLRRGVDPVGLSSGEARAVTYRLHARQEAGWLSYRQVKACALVLNQRPAEMSRVFLEETKAVDFEPLMQEFWRRGDVH